MSRFSLDDDDDDDDDDADDDAGVAAVAVRLALTMGVNKLIIQLAVVGDDGDDGCLRRVNCVVRCSRRPFNSLKAPLFGPDAARLGAREAFLISREASAAPRPSNECEKRARARGVN